MKHLSTILLGLAISQFCYSAEKPNIVFIFADDMGYGDVQCLNPERGKIATPHMDKLAKEGMIFTDAHTTSSVCTPTRYSLMTGRYNWRTTLQKHVTSGYSPPLIGDDTLTVGKVLQQSGYNTAMIGKWHIGMTLPTTDGKGPRSGGKDRKSNVDWKGEVLQGPHDRGFDYYYGTTASLDMPPYVYIENRKFLGEGTELKAFHRQGDADKDFEAIDVLDNYGTRAANYISEQSIEKPFFLYVPLTSPHTPIIPTEQWKGKSGINIYADFQMQTDAVIGQIINAVDAAGLKENTLIIVSSDNGCSKRANFKQLEAAGHYASAQFRGSKSDIWEGGLRVPFIVRWPATVKPDSVSNETVLVSDFLATCADIVQFQIPETSAPDSVSF
ncbi:arylsulfatase, partial [Akkermansiaceae bacterium]|nr:arylsulfatase [Akkermansiaceae bacterium]